MNDRLSPPEIAPCLSAMQGVEETAYTWNIASGRLEWEPNAAAVLGMSGIETVAALERHMSPDARPWHQKILNATATGNPAGERYYSRYKLRPHLNDIEIWVEDTGRWWPGPDGRPGHARGVIRVLDGHLYEREPKASCGTGRDRLVEMIDVALARTAQTQKAGALLLIAVANLTKINASFGVSVGDELIAAVARLLESRIERKDSLAFYSSNILGVVLDDTSKSSMHATAEGLIAAVREATFATSVCPLTATICIGGVLLPAQAKTAAEAMSKAFETLERARLEAADRFVPFEEERREEVRRRNITAASTVLSALDEGRMHFVLQPIVSARTGKPEMYECLLRMMRPDGTIASAGEFIRVAEELGLARNIDKYTLALAVALLEAHPRLKLSLNVSGYTANDGGWAAALHRLAGDRRELARRLMIEITETAMVQDLARTSAFIEMLREAGCPVAIDDFGAGYTSFGHLTQLKIDVLKIDGAFVKNLPSDHQGRLLIKSIIETAKAFGVKTVAEWVGDEMTAAFLRGAGIDFLQGHLYGAPISVDALLAAR